MGNAGSGGRDGAAQQVESVLEELRGLERRVGSIHALQRHEALAVTRALGGAAGGAGPAGAGPAAGAAAAVGSHSLQQSLSLFGAHVPLGPARVLVGPVVGLVTESTARVLVEVDRDAVVSLHVCMLDELCPGGREVARVALRLRARRPAALAVDKLAAGTAFHICLGGVSREDALGRTGRFSTVTAGRSLRVGGVAGNCIGWGRPATEAGGNCAWAALRDRVDHGGLDLLVHCGGQVDLRPVFARCAAMLEQQSEVSAVAEVRVREELAAAYRAAWNEPKVRHVLSRVSNLMIWGEQDCPTLPVRSTLPPRSEAEHRERALVLAALAGQGAPPAPYPARLLVLARQVYREYQRQLWDAAVRTASVLDSSPSPDVEPALPSAAPSSDEVAECFFQRPHPALGVLVLDPRGCQFRADGVAKAWPACGLSSDKQWD